MCYIIKRRCCYSFFQKGALAQLGERLPCTQEVSGSIPLGSTNDLCPEEYPSLAEGIGLENRQAGQTARGFESLFLLHSDTIDVLFVEKASSRYFETTRGGATSISSLEKHRVTSTHESSLNSYKRKMSLL